MQRSSIRDAALHRHLALRRSFELAAAPQGKYCDNRLADQTDGILNLNDVIDFRCERCPASHKGNVSNSRATYPGAKEQPEKRDGHCGLFAAVAKLPPNLEYHNETQRHSELATCYLVIGGVQVRKCRKVAVAVAVADGQNGG